MTREPTILWGDFSEDENVGRWRASGAIASEGLLIRKRRLIDTSVEDSWDDECSYRGTDRTPARPLSPPFDPNNPEFLAEVERMRRFLGIDGDKE